MRETLEKVACMEGKLSAAEGSRKKLLSDVDALMLIKSQHTETQYALEKVFFVFRCRENNRIAVCLSGSSFVLADASKVER